jgi:hypothetical protein
MTRIILAISILTITFISCMDKKTKLLSEIKEDGFPQKEVAVSLDRFFIDNNDLGSIGVNIDPQPEPKEFYNVLLKIRSSRKTENIFVRISDADDTDWFYTDAVYIVGDWTADEIKEMMKDLSPDEVYEGWLYGKPINISETGNQVHTVWWD